MNELEELERKSHEIHRKIRFEPDFREKERIKQESEITRLDAKIAMLKEQRELQEQKDYDQKTIDLILENYDFIIYEVNGQRTPIPKSLEVPIHFIPCGHKVTMNLKEIPRGQGQNNAQLYHTWDFILTSHGQGTKVEGLRGSMNCQECRSKIEEIKRTLHIVRGSDQIGHTNWMIRRLQ